MKNSIARGAQLVAIVISMGVANVIVKSVFESRPTSAAAQVDAAMLAASQNMNKKTPMQVDNITTLESTAYADKTMYYTYKVSSFSVSDFSEPKRQKLEREHFQEKRNKLCTTPESKKMFEFGMKMVHKYYGNDGKLVFETKISGSDCAGV
jgi:predicted dienelactone hydrolase